MLVEQIGKLEGTIAHVEDREAQEQRYKANKLTTGCPGYAHKKFMSEGRPPHCPHAPGCQKNQPLILELTHIGVVQFVAFDLLVLEG